MQRLGPLDPTILSPTESIRSPEIDSNRFFRAGVIATDDVDLSKLRLKEIRVRCPAPWCQLLPISHTRNLQAPPHLRMKQSLSLECPSTLRYCTTHSAHFLLVEHLKCHIKDDFQFLHVFYLGDSMSITLARYSCFESYVELKGCLHMYCHTA